MSAADLACHGFESSTDRVAVGTEGDRTFADLLADVARVMAVLDADRTPVLITCHDRYRFTVALLATWQRGATAWLASTPDARVERVSTPQALCLHDGDGPGLDLRELLAQPAIAPLPSLGPIAAQQRLVTLSTSGSTGVPVAVDKSARQLLGEAQALCRAFGELPACPVLSTVPPRHIYGLLFGVLLPLRLGVPFVRETPLLPEAIVEAARRTQAGVLVAVPAHLGSLAASRVREVAPLRCVFSSGARLPAATFDTLGEGLALRTFEVLGSTETGGVAWRSSAREPFLPFEGVRPYVSDAGDLSVTSPYLDDNTAPFPTGDRVELLSDGRFEHLGRVDGVVKVGGTRVSLAALEERARALPGVRDAAALAVQTGGARGNEVWLALAADDWDVPRLRAALGEWFEPVALPRRYRFVTHLPRAANGKLPQAALHALFADGGDEPHTLTANPRTKGFQVLGLRHDSQATSERVYIDLSMSADLAYFEGHFPGYPILPGVVQLQVLAIDNMQRAWPALGAVREVRRLKFTRPITPTDRLSLELHHVAAAVDASLARVDFKLVVDAVQCATGSVFFARKAPAP